MEKSHILLADDHAIVREGFRKMIEQIPGMEVIDEIGNGPQLFNALKQHFVNLLIIDVNMPEFEPISAIRKIRAQYPDLKILVVSAYDDDYFVKGLINVGVNGYHLKDQSLHDLGLAIERVLAGERWISSELLNKLVKSSSEKEIIPELTNRQREILSLLQQGCDNKSIAQQMDLSVKTIENHLTRLYCTLDVQSRLEAVNYLTRFPQVLGIPGVQISHADQKLSLGIDKAATILIVDDNARYRKHLMRMIGKAFPRAIIYEAQSIEDTLMIADQIRFQLALIDVILGDSDGITCARRLHRNHPHIRIVLISAYPDREFHRQGMEAGAAAFLDKKNLDLPTIRQVIDDIIAL